MMMDMRRVWVLALLAIGCIGQTKQVRYWDRWEDDEVATVITHVWISTDGDFSAATSWSTGIAPGAPVSATATLTIDTQPLDTKTVTIGTKVYTFQTVLTEADGHVLIGATAATAKANLIDAINLGAGLGTDYALATTKNADVVASDPGGNDILVTALVGGQTGNLLATTSTMTAGANAWAAAIMSGGTGWNPGTGAAPGDNVEFNGTSVVSATSGLTQVSTKAWTLTTTPEYTGTIGSSGTPLTMTTISRMTVRGSGAVFYHNQTISGLTLVITVDSINLTDALVYGAEPAAIARALYVKSGHADVNSDTLIPIIGTFGVSASLSVPGPSIEGPFLVHCDQGFIDLDRNGFSDTTGKSTWTVSGGTLDWSGDWVGTSSGTPPTLIVTDGGRLIHTGGEITQTGRMYFLGGVVDLSESGETFGTLVDSVIGPNVTIIETVKRQLQDSVFALTDLRKDVP